MSHQTFQLRLDIHSYWAAGSGSQAGAYADSLVIKHNGLPYLPGKQLRGLLKRAFMIAQDAQWINQEQLDKLFGQSGPNTQGIIQVSSAHLCDIEQQYFENNPSHKSLLFHTKDTQAVNHDSGVTKPGSLRTMEVAVPMSLIAEINLSEEFPSFKDLLKDCCQLITSIGSHKNRGHGKVTITVIGVE